MDYTSFWEVLDPPGNYYRKKALDNCNPQKTDNETKDCPIRTVAIMGKSPIVHGANTGEVGVDAKFEQESDKTLRRFVGRPVCAIRAGIRGPVGRRGAAPKRKGVPLAGREMRNNLNGL